MIRTPSIPSILESAKLIATHAQQVKISQSGVAEAARKVGSHPCSDLKFIYYCSKHFFFSWLQLLGAICSENMGGVAAVINDGKGGVTTVTNPLEPPGLSENDTLEW